MKYQKLKTKNKKHILKTKNIYIFKFVFLIFNILFFIYPLTADMIEPPGELIARDNPNDGGGKIRVTWKLSPSDSVIEGYKILRQQEDDTVILQVGFIGQGRNSFTDERTTDKINYSYQIIATIDNLSAAGEWSSLVKSEPQWFHTERTNVVIFTLLFTFLIIYFINRAKKGAKLFVRKIPGLLAVEDAVGRATEMGKPILYVPGLTGITDVATIAALNILGEVAKKVAQYESTLIVPNTDPIVYTVAREVVKEAYTEVGRPDAFKQDSVYFITDSQFAYAAAVDGIMTREKPAANFFMGYFYAEALILAETGASTGAVQIAGTDSVTQLPFFIVACDYTLMGEELYAASAYLSREPLLLGGLIGQDWGKAVIVTILIVLTIVGIITNLPVLKIF